MGTVTVHKLGKAYRQYPHRWARLREWLTPGESVRHTLKWILKDIDFHIHAGESVGIVGINGAGKSTLLKLITGTTQPTSGTVQVGGRIAALLELGLGFHPDFTGRQNAIMAGQLLGLQASEVEALLPEIEAFAEIGDYIDQPVRVYSSGMQVRLAFSVATARRPDVLIVDEALAVGDVYFQQKCYQRIQSFVAQGTTLLFVTHSMGTVLEVCTRAIYLSQGRVVYDGTPKEAIDLYQADLLVQLDQGSSKRVERQNTANESAEERSPLLQSSQVQGGLGSISSSQVTCLDVQLVDKNHQKLNALVSGERAELLITYLMHDLITDPHIGFKVRDKYGSVIFETNTYCMGRNIGEIKAGNQLATSFRFPVDLIPGDYTITVGLGNEGYGESSFKESLSYLHDVLMFQVLPNVSDIVWGGIVNLHPQFNCSIIQESRMPSLDRNLSA